MPTAAATPAQASLPSIGGPRRMYVRLVDESRLIYENRCLAIILTIVADI